MSSSSIVDGNTSIDMDIRFVLKKCLCGEFTDVKITHSNKNKNRGRIYYTCKSKRCGSFLGWCKIDSIEQAPNTIATVEECNTSENSVIREVHSNHDGVPWTWKTLTIIAFILSTCLAIKCML